MLAFDVFSNQVFQATEVNETVGDIVYIPTGLGSMNIFDPEPIRTKTVTIVQDKETLALIPITERGTRPTTIDRDTRSAVQLSTVRLATEDRINAGEVQDIINEFIPLDTALEHAQDEVDKRQRKMMRKLELTREFHRMAAIQGKVVDADGSVYMDFFEQFGFARPAAITFDLANLDGGDLRQYIAQHVVRPMTRALGARAVPGWSIGALCDDNFYDALVKAPEIYKTYMNYSAAADLREKKVWDSFPFAGVNWMNYQGTVDMTTIAVPANSCIFFPIGAEDVFKEYLSPDEDWRQVNTLGQEFYSYVVPDPRAPALMDFVDVLLRCYPLYANICPQALLRGVLA